MKNSNSLCKVENLNHVCIAVNDIKKSIHFYSKIFGTKATEITEISDQGVLATLISLGNTHLEFIQPLDVNGSIAKFIQKRGEGIHHICFEVENLEQTLNNLDSGDIDLIDKKPRKGLAGNIAFIHPKSTYGTLIELVDKNSIKELN
ncbi:MAG: methylmalonyl-CoA epimerase [Chloroflexi bacterium]|jgi:methylmalonyl-CoA/ethylmalonyl-CoA epimerase|nr:methylmalonyl-CoA epimerase [Chloroflexota bacterium]MCH2304070.1 methylmalonyl-CoA epimerase [SAR202 cluster bacterium]|tara:strand:+ start:60 stop:500 length:441 start_codon:yes stop_codon:yes gene_type:complete